MFSPKLAILPPALRQLWPELASLPDHLVLYGGTAIALRLGHRTSVDFDFFTDVDLDGDEKDRLLKIAWLKDADVLQNDEGTLTVSVETGAGAVKLSFFGGLKCGRIGEPDRTDDAVVCVASLKDLLAHKLKVVHDRAAGRDYQDIAAILTSGQDLARAVAGARALFRPALPAMIMVKASPISKMSQSPGASLTRSRRRLSPLQQVCPSVWTRRPSFLRRCVAI
jgi:hypothetical protein